MDHPLLPASRSVVHIGVLALTAFFAVRGLVPALSGLSTDFPNYYTAARLVSEGRDLTHLYNDNWFQDRIREYGMEEAGKFSPFPPPTALLLVPLSALPPSDALRVFTLLNCVLLIAGVFFFRTVAGASPGGETTTKSADGTASSRSLRIVGGYASTTRRLLHHHRLLEGKSDDPLPVNPLEISALIILLSGLGLANCFRFGQWYVAMSVALLAAYRFYGIGRPYISGILLGIFLPIKYFPLLPLLAFALAREWKVVTSALVTAALVVTAGVWVLGWPVHEEFLGHVLLPHMGGHFGNQGSFSSAFQSWDALLRQLFVRDSVENPVPMTDSTALFWSLKLLVFVLVLSGVLLTLRRAWNIAPGNRLEAAIVLFSIAGLLLAPGTATYHFVLLWLPMALFLSLLARHGEVLWGRLALALYGLIGFIPFTFFQRFDRTGPGSVFSFPRLALLAALFCIALAGISRISNPARREQETENR